MNALTERTASVIAAEIRSIDSQTREIVLRSAVEIGKRLHEAKALVPHGEWGAWLDEHVSYSQSSANNFMRISEEYGTNFQALGNLNYSQAVALLGVPAEEREQFAADVEAEKLSSRELQTAVKARQEAEKRQKQLEEDLNKIQQQVDKERKERKSLEDTVLKLQIELAEARIAGKDDEALQLQQELADAQAKVKQLEAELKAKPIDVPAVVEKVPEEVERELAELRKQVGQSASMATIKFKVQFGVLVKGFDDLLTTLGEIQAADPEQAGKYKEAARGLIEKMMERL